MQRHPLTVASWLLVLPACQLVGGFEGFELASDNAAAQDNCPALPVVKEDARTQSVMTRFDIPGSTCAWIDATEVTVRQYQAFLDAAKVSSPSFEPTWCQWKQQASDPISDPADACTMSIMRFDLQPFGPLKPIRCVDFCDAEAYCRWAGKHLCYDRAGMGNQGPSGFPPEWVLGCTNSRATIYPWGDESDGKECNFGQTSDRCVANDPTCGPHLESGTSSCMNQRGALDLLGNVAEWTFSCTFVNSAKPLEPSKCLTRGGAYDDDAQSCAPEHSVSADARAPDLGFRCCADLTANEQVQLRSR